MMQFRRADLEYLAIELCRHMNRLNAERLQVARDDKAFQAFLHSVTKTPEKG